MLKEKDDMEGEMPAQEAAQAPPADLLEKKEKELKELNDKYLRLTAEFENYKKRTSREQLDFMKYAFEPVLREYLPLLDNLERALFHSKESKDLNKLNEGLQLMIKQCQEVLSRFEVSPIPAKGEPFDPARHQAISQVETDEFPDNHVAEEVSKGYYYKDRVLRPTMVSVSRKKQE
jgi:molecular chaperone GrpE